MKALTEYEALFLLSNLFANVASKVAPSEPTANLIFGLEIKQPLLADSKKDFARIKELMIYIEKIQKKRVKKLPKNNKKIRLEEMQRIK